MFLKFPFLLLSIASILWYEKIKNQKCYAFSFSSLFIGSKNNIKGRVKSKQYSANNPIEDRVVQGNFKQIDGFVTAVLDGHGGYNVAEYISQNLVSVIEKCIINELGKTKEQFYNKPLQEYHYRDGK